MGSGKSIGQKPTTSPQDMLDYLDDLFAYALLIGMSYEQYWLDDPKLMKAYIKADEMRQIRKNNDMWLQGLYNYLAVGNLAPILNPLSKDHKARPYLKQPMPITQKEIELQEEQRVNRIYNKFVALANANKES